MATGVDVEYFDDVGLVRAQEGFEQGGAYAFASHVGAHGKCHDVAQGRVAGDIAYGVAGDCGGESYDAGAGGEDGLGAVLPRGRCVAEVIVCVGDG